jgi:class 3 adenylate cyclase
MLDQANRTFICSVVFIDLVGYSKKPVAEQIRLKTSLTNNLSEAIKDIPVNDRIILDTGDGAAISFLGDPEDALFTCLSLRESMLRDRKAAGELPEGAEEDSVRTGINLGPVKLVKDINGHPNIVGDGINVAQRIMSFARPGQVVVSRSYYDVVSNLATEYAKLFTYEGSRTDKHVREHEIYVVGHSEGALKKAQDSMKDRAVTTSTNVKRTASAAAPGSSTVTLTIPGFVQDKKKLAMVAGGLAVVVTVLGILVATKKSGAPEPAPTVASAPAPAPVPAKPVEAPKAEPAAGTADAKKEPATADGTKPDAGKPDATKPDAAKPGASAVPAKADAAKPDAAKADAAKPDAAKPAVPPATVVFAIQPWGEIFVNGKPSGVSPPMKSLKLVPGKYKIEIRNTTFAAHTENLDVKSRDEITIRHKFQ